MFCRNCGKEFTGKPELCMGCGAKPGTGSSFCMACGAETNPLAELCITCGSRLPVSSKATAPGTTASKATASKSAAPKAAVSKSGASKATVSASAAPKARVLMPAAPKTTVAAPAEPKTGVSTTAEPKAAAAPAPGNISPKSRLATTLLALLLGIYGAHQFYLGKVGAGMAMLILGILGTIFFFGNVADSILRFFTGFLGPVDLPFPFRYVFIVFLIAIVIWAFVDFLSAALGRFRDADDKLIQDWGA
jgi:TM2 domain-containing membrane protein YozV